MTNLHYTPLPISQQLASLGIEVESEKWWTNDLIVLEYDKEWHLADYDTDYIGVTFLPAYTLSDLPAVLKAVGEKKKWSYYAVCDLHGVECVIDCSRAVPTEWQYHFLTICKLYATDPNAAWKYLGEIIN